jgi:hypothetical protein
VAVADGSPVGPVRQVTLLPLNDAMVLTFLAPMWVAILSPALLHEKPSKCAALHIPPPPGT